MWKTNEAYPTAAKLPSLAKLLNCTIDELLQKETHFKTKDAS